MRYYGSDSDGGEVVSREAIGPNCDSSRVFKPAEGAFDEIASVIGFAIEREELSSLGGRRDDEADMTALETAAQRVGNIGFVAQQAFKENIAQINVDQKRYRYR